MGNIGRPREGARRDRSRFDAESEVGQESAYREAERFVGADWTGASMVLGSNWDQRGVGHFGECVGD